MRHVVSVAAFGLASALVLSACGGGGGGSDTASPAATNGNTSGTVVTNAAALPMFRTCPITDRLAEQKLLNDPKIEQCLQGTYFGKEYKGTRDCSLNVTAAGKVTFSMAAESAEIASADARKSELKNTSAGESGALFESEVKTVSWAVITLIGDLANKTVLATGVKSDPSLIGAKSLGYCEFH